MIIRGQVKRGQEAIVPISILDKREGRFRILDFVLDTGFHGDIVLPSKLIHSLDLDSIGNREVVLADGEPVEVAAYNITARVHDQSHDLVALELGSSVLLGMSFLWGNKVTLEVTDRGAVIIEQLHTF